MVRSLFLIIFSMFMVYQSIGQIDAFISYKLYAQNEEGVKITAEIGADSFENTPLKGTITVTHDKRLSVDPDSILLDKKPIKVNFVKEVPLSADTVISIYEFSIPAMPKGLHLLPETSVVVGVQRYVSVPSTFTVKEKKETPQSSVPATPQISPQKGDAPVILQLENIVSEDTTLYPGQRINVGYRYSYSYGFDLSKEEIPLLEGKGFRKIGGKEVKENTKGALAILEVTQLLEAEVPGEYSFGPGIIEGRAYKRGALGQKIQDQSIKQAETPAVTLKVIPFPEEGKPASFKGAVGNYDFNVSLSSPTQVNVGDKITLLVKVTGTGAIDSVPIPDICCQPGFSGFFRLSDLPPEEKIENNTKTFYVEMRPLSASITEIPSIEFSFFNPQDKRYTTLKSQPIPITVNPVKVKEQTPLFEEEIKEKQTEPEALNAIEIEGNTILTTEDLKNKLFGTWKVLWIIPFSIGILLLQIQMKNYILNYKQQIKTETSTDIFNKALEFSPQSPEFFNLIHRAFLLRLVERGEIASIDIAIDSLSERGASGKVRRFLTKIESQRFSGKQEATDKDLLAETRELFHELDK